MSSGLGLRTCFAKPRTDIAVFIQAVLPTAVRPSLSPGSDAFLCRASAVSYSVLTKHLWVGSALSYPVLTKRVTLPELAEQLLQLPAGALTPVSSFVANTLLLL